MNKTSLISVAALAITLASCSKEPVPKEAESAPSVHSETAAPEQTGAASATVAAETEIPEVLRGRWGLVPGDCTSTKGDAKGLMTVSADKLEFYESVASLGPIKEIDANGISAAYQFSGEGQSWILDVAMSTPDGGKTLIREDTGPEAQPGPLTYKKCS